MIALRLMLVLSVLQYSSALQLKRDLAIDAMEDEEPVVHVRPGGGLCAGGQVVPQLYFLGAQKAATTTISDAFQVAGGLLAREPQCMQCLGHAKLLLDNVSAVDEATHSVLTNTASLVVGMNNLTTPSYHHRCDNLPVEINGVTWGNLGQGDEEQCKRACLAEQKCNFATLNLKGVCSAFLQCDKFKATGFTWRVFAKQHQSLVPMEPVRDFDPRYGVSIEVMQRPSVHWRCDGRPISLNNDTWNNLGNGDAEHCKRACLEEPLCNFAVLNQEGHCSAFQSCGKLRVTRVSWQVFVKQHDTVEGECKMWCTPEKMHAPWEKLCNWQKCNQCQPCQEAQYLYGGKSTQEVIGKAMSVVQGFLYKYGETPEEQALGELATSFKPMCIRSSVISDVAAKYGWTGWGFSKTPNLRALLHELSTDRMDRMSFDCQVAGGLWHPINESTETGCTNNDGYWIEEHFQKERRVFSEGMEKPAKDHPEFYRDWWFLNKLSKGYPECPPSGATPVLAADFSTYFGYPTSLARIGLAYGNAADHVTLAVSIRDPIARLQSVFGHLKQEPWSDDWTTPAFARNRVWESFGSFVRNMMFAYKRTNECTHGVFGEHCTKSQSLRPGFTYSKGDLEMDLLLWSQLRCSLYGSSLNKLTDHFSPHQIVLAPMKDIVDGGEKSKLFMKQIQVKTGTDVEAWQGMPSTFADAVASHTASNSHNTSAKSQGDEDDDMRHLRSIMDDDLHLLVTTLMNKQKISLPTYKGNRDDYESIQGWLKYNW